MSTTTIDNLVGAMINIAQEAAAQGKHDEAVSRLSSFIETVEQGDRKMHDAYGPYMTRMYALRAAYRFDGSGQAPDPAQMEQAQKDVEKADAAFQTYYGGIDPVQKEAIRAAIHNLACPDEAQRSQSLALVTQLGPGDLARPGGGAVRSVSAAPTGSSSKFIEDVKVRLPAFLIGAVLWIIAAVFLFSGNQALMTPGLVIAVILWLLSIYGWEAFPYRGGDRLRAVATMFLIITVVGLVIVAYWSGCGVLKLGEKLGL